MSRYFIETKHTPEECLRALDEVLAMGPTVLDRFEWGCMADDHTGYAMTEADKDYEAWDLVPEFLRHKARVIKLNRFTPDQIRSFHKKSA